MNWAKPRSIEELKALCLDAEGCRIEGFIQLMGAARSSKQFTYRQNERKPWEVFEGICDAYVELTDEELLDHGVLSRALERGALFIEIPDEEV